MQEQQTAPQKKVTLSVFYDYAFMYYFIKFNQKKLRQNLNCRCVRNYFLLQGKEIS